MPYFVWRCLKMSYFVHEVKELIYIYINISEAFLIRSLKELYMYRLCSSCEGLVAYKFPKNLPYQKETFRTYEMSANLWTCTWITLQSISRRFHQFGHLKEPIGRDWNPQFWFSQIDSLIPGQYLTPEMHFGKEGHTL